MTLATVVRIAVVIAILLSAARLHADEKPLPEQAAAALERAVKFYHGTVAAHGGYVYRYSADLEKREGEGKTDRNTVWVQPPGTPAVGMAYVEAYERLGDEYLLAAARDAGACLMRGQMQSGGWNAEIYFDAERRKRYLYRFPPQKKRGERRNITSFDDDKTQSALRMLMRLDQVTKFEDNLRHKSAHYALDQILKAQFPNGGWAQVFDEIPDHAGYPVKQASYPDDWPRKYPGGDYWKHYTLNDNAIVDTLETLLLATRIYGDKRYRESAIWAADFFLLAQLPDPQPAWAQQYDANMHPVWARKFEPPAISGGESQNVVRALLRMYAETGERKYLDSAGRAIAYLKKSEIAPGKLARFYELKTNRPLYFVKDSYELTYDDDNLPTHYAFQVSSKVAGLAKDHEELVNLPPDQLAARPALKLRDELPPPPKVSPELEARVREVIAALDDRGAWIESGRLKYHGNDDDTRRVIESATFIKNVQLLSGYLAAVRGR